MARPVNTVGATGAELVRRLIKVRQDQIRRLENEIKQLQQVAEAEEARQVKVPGT